MFSKKYVLIIIFIFVGLFLCNYPIQAQFNIILNFDDGYSGVYLNAFPILKKAKIPAVVFMPTKYVGQKNHLNLDELKELRAHHWEIGSHTVNHPNLAELTPVGLNYEIINSRKYLLENDLIDRDYASFCSPMTVWNKQISKITDNNYQVIRAKKLIFVNESEIEIKASLKVILQNTKIKTIKYWIEQAVKLNQTLVLIFHEVADEGNQYYFPPAKFKELIPILQKYKIITYKQFLDEYIADLNSR